MSTAKPKREWRKGLMALLRPLLRLVARVSFGASTKVYRHIKGPYLVLSNHSYVMDAALVGIAFVEPVHVVASSVTLKSSAAGRLVHRLAAPIALDKAGMDIASIRRILGEAKAGHSIALFPEGTITMDGRPAPYERSVAKLAKKLKLKVVLYRVEGGYLKKPKWATEWRKGRVVGAVQEVIDAEEVADMSVDELYMRIQNGINYDAFAAQQTALVPYRGKRMAEGIERLLYFCPKCKCKADFVSKANDFVCSHCGERYSIDEYGHLTGPFANTALWNEWQKKYIFEYPNQEEYLVQGNLFAIGEEAPVATGTLALDDAGISIGDMHVALADLDGATLYGVNSIMLGFNGVQYRFVPYDEHANSIPLAALIQSKL